MTETATQAAAANGGKPATPELPPDPEVEALERRKKIAELEQAIAEARKGGLAARLPTTEGSGIEGVVELGEGSGYFAEVLAYEALAAAAEEIGEKLGGGRCDEVVVTVGNDLVHQRHLLDIATVRIEDTIQGVRQLIEDLEKVRLGRSVSTDEQRRVALLDPLKGFQAAATAAVSFVGAAADLASFFRSDLTASGREVGVTSTAALAAVAASLRKNDWKPLLPSARLERSALLTKIETLLEGRRVLARRRRELERDVQPVLQEHAVALLAEERAEARLAAARAAKPPDQPAVDRAQERWNEARAELAPLAVRAADWQRAAAAIDAAISAADTLAGALLEGRDGKPSVVEATAAVALLESEEDLRVLTLEVSSRGGESFVTRNAFRTRLTYLGGVVVSFLLTDGEGEVEKSGMVARTAARSVRVHRASLGLAVPPVKGSILRWLRSWLPWEGY